MKLDLCTLNLVDFMNYVAHALFAQIYLKTQKSLFGCLLGAASGPEKLEKKRRSRPK